MRVACVTRHFPSSQSPWAGHSAYQTLRLLAKRCDLHVFYPDATYPKLLRRRGASPVDANWHPADVEATYIYTPALPFVSRPLNGLVVSRYLYKHVHEYRPDIVLNYFVYPDGYGAVKLARKLGVPSVLTGVGSDLHSIPGRLCRVLTQTALREADFISTVSSDLRSKAIALGSDPRYTRTKLNGCDTEVFQPRDRQQARKYLGLPEEAEIVLYVGRMDVRKGLMELVEAIATLAPERPNLRCYLVGDGPDSDALTEAMRKHGVADRITAVAPVGTAGVAQWMAASNVVTLPSYKEGCPNVVIEGLASGRPVVATNVGGIPELMDDTCGRLVPPKDAAALTTALRDVLDHAWDATAISERRGRGWADVTDDLYTVLCETIERFGRKTAHSQR